jgi:hypothetical protein
MSWACGTRGLFAHAQRECAERRLVDTPLSFQCERWRNLGTGIGLVV